MSGGRIPKATRSADTIPAVLSPGAAWCCPGGHLNRDEDTCWCGQPMGWVQA